jgi:serine/threonine-protein kinase
MVGTIVGTYRLEERIGDGGLGAVYRAVDGASGREAAFRVFAPEVSADAMLADRLRALAPALKRLQHPNIAAFFELVTLGPDLAMFFEFVPGASLEKVRQPAGRLHTNVAVSCAVQVLRALEFAHATGVLHHALRPGNVMVTRQGTVKVLDFGIGHAFGANRKTREDRLLAVLAYLAPEQIQNQPGDARSDIYAVGVLLYEMLTGRLPFDHKTEFALRQAHLAEPPVAPRLLVPGLPEWLDQAVLRALAKNQASRYQNATEFRAVLEAALGLSTSREAAIVRQRDGASLETFAAAPPIPAPLPSGAPTTVAVGGGGVTTGRSAGLAGADAAETVLAAGAVGAAPDAASSRVAPTASAPGSRAARRGPMFLIASAVAAIGLAAAGLYYAASRHPAPPAGAAPAGEAAASVPAEARPPAPAADAAAAPVTPPAAPPLASAAAPATAAAPAKPSMQAPAGTAPSPARPAKPKPAPAKQPLAPPPAGTPAASVSAPPAAAAAAPAPPPAPAEKVPDVSYRKVKLVTQAGASERTADVVLLFSDDRLSVTPAGGGAALRTLRYAEITGASYSKAQRKRLGFISSSRHLLEIETAAEPLMLRLDKDNVEPILAALEARAGRAVGR